MIWTVSEPVTKTDAENSTLKRLLTLFHWNVSPGVVSCRTFIKRNFLKENKWWLPLMNLFCF